MSWQKIRQNFINMLPVGRSIRRKLSIKYGWFPGNNVCPDVQISVIKKLKLGKNVYIGNRCDFRCAGGLKIGSGTSVAAETIILTSNHNYNSDYMLPYDNVAILQAVEIGENCWIGRNSMILLGVKIDDGAIVGMGSVVTKSVPKCAIVAGNPAKIVGWRDIKKYSQMVADRKIRGSKWECPSGTLEIEGFKKYLD